jgi:hypothetical protein
LTLPTEIVARLDALTAPPEIYPHWHWRNAADRAADEALGQARPINPTLDA